MFPGLFFFCCCCFTVPNNATLYLFMVNSAFPFLECLRQSGTVLGTVHPATSETYKAPVLMEGRDTQQIDAAGQVVMSTIETGQCKEDGE